MMRSKSTIVSRHHGLGHQQYNNNNNGHNVRKPRSPSTFIKPSQHRSFSFPFYRALRSWKSLNMPLQRSTSMKEPLPLAPSANLQFPRPSSPYVDPLAKQYQPSVVNDVEMSNPERSTSPVPTEIVEEDKPFNPDSQSAILAAHNIKVRDFAFNPEGNKNQARETFNPMSAMYELAHCSVTPHTSRQPMNAKSLHRLIAAGFIPEQEARSRLGMPDWIVLNVYRTSPRVQYPWVTVADPMFMKAKTWTSIERDSYFKKILASPCPLPTSAESQHAPG